LINKERPPMTYTEPADTAAYPYPPGHPAGTDEFISAGEVESGRGLGEAGSLDTRVRVVGETTRAGDTPTKVAASKGPIVLIAVDGASMSERVVRTARRLFGDGATYLAINVGEGPYTEMKWEYLWPTAGMSTWSAPPWSQDRVDSDDEVPSADQRAEAEARLVMHDAGLDRATPIGDVGDPASAIIWAAHQHRADVVVVGADSRSWVSRLFAGSVERELLREADFAVLVVADEDAS
jgi:nucleotide-binding universal stress UspA family protein